MTLAVPHQLWCRWTLNSLVYFIFTVFFFFSFSVSRIQERHYLRSPVRIILISPAWVLGDLPSNFGHSQRFHENFPLMRVMLPLGLKEKQRKCGKQQICLPLNWRHTFQLSSLTATDHDIHPSFIIAIPLYLRHCNHDQKVIFLSIESTH